MRNFIKKHRKILYKLLIAMVILAAAVWGIVQYCNYRVDACRQYCYADLNQVPETETALFLGVAKINKFGNPNLYFVGRIEAAVKLFQAGKIKHFLISGDNSRRDYDEPTDIKNVLVERGVPVEAITLDYAGFSTLDSMVRAKNVFGKNEFIIITQKGHAERAVYIARKHGIKATAFYAAEPTAYPTLVAKNRFREKLARVKAWLDVNIFHTKPKFKK